MNLNEWSAYWESLEVPNYYKKPAKDDPDTEWFRVSKLLAKYTGGVEADNIFFTGIYFSKIGRIFSGHWNRHYTSEVKKVLNSLIKCIGDDDYHHCYKVSNILGRLKYELSLNHKTIQPNGELDYILKIIQEKTGIDFNNTNAISEEANYNQMVANEKTQTKKLTNLMNDLNQEIKNEFKK